MAIMRPEKLPSAILNDPLLRGEVKTYEALKKLPDEFVVFYQCYASPDMTSKAYERKIDFVILHKVLGLLAMEVKGGNIRLEENVIEQFFDKKWNAIDPFDQVSRAIIELIMNCKNDGADYWIPENICVVFPDKNRIEITNRPNRIPNGVLCADDLGILPVQIKTLFSKPRKDYAFTDKNFLDMQRRLAQRISATGKRKKYNKEKTVNRSPSNKLKINYQPQPLMTPAKSTSEKAGSRKTITMFFVAFITFVASTAVFWMLINFIRTRA